MMSIGHRTGLFDALRTLPPATSAEIAKQAGLNERYVREWLGAMVTAGVVEVDPVATRFVLPPEHAAYLTRPAAADNLAVFARYIPLLGAVEDDIVACFKNGGGVPYARFPRFHAVMAEDSGQSVLSALESHILPLVPGLAERLAAGLSVLDVGCGRGRILHRLAQLFPASRFYTVSCMHCMTVSLAQGGEGVGAMWGQQLTRDYLRRAGFSSIETHQPAHDIQNNWYVVRR